MSLWRKFKWPILGVGSGVAILNRVVEKASLRRGHKSKDLDKTRGKKRVMQLRKSVRSREYSKCKDLA